MAKIDITTSEESTLAQRGYKLSKLLGEGSYAKVYHSEYQSQDNETKILACKIIDVAKAPKDFVKKFLPRELDILEKVNHPHIIHVHSIFQRRNKYFIFMRFAENGDLLEFILKRGAVSEGQSRVWMRQLCLGMQYLHELEIAHRDLKCENCLITQNYNLKISDFGFSRFVTDIHGRKLTSDTYCGSLSYAAPEVLKGSPYLPKIADIWSVGVILYIMINKSMPFDDSNVKKLLDQQLNKQWKLRSRVVDVVSLELKELLQQMLEPDPMKRWRIDQILASEWFYMDPKLVNLTPAEKAAMNNIKEDRKKYLEEINMKAKMKYEPIADIKVIKDDKKGKASPAINESAPSLLT